MAKESIWDEIVDIATSLAKEVPIVNAVLDYLEKKENKKQNDAQEEQILQLKQGLEQQAKKWEEVAKNWEEVMKTSPAQARQNASKIIEERQAAGEDISPQVKEREREKKSYYFLQLN